MSALDLVARGLATQASADRPATFIDYASRVVPATVQQLATSGFASPGKGAGRYVTDELADAALHSAHPDCVLRTADGRFFRLTEADDGLIHVDCVGASGDGVTSDSTALAAALDYCVAIGASGLRLGAGTYAVDTAYGLTWIASNTALVGEGAGKTILRQIDHLRNDGSALRIGDCENIRVADLTIHGANGFGSLYSNGSIVRNATFERVTFTSDPQSTIDGSWFASTNGVRWVAEGSASVSGLRFIDCTFLECGRMGIEFQNHTGDTVPRFRDIQIIRPKFIDIGGANQSAGYSAGMGISLSGYGEDITIFNPSFDNVREICLELVGASRVKVTDIRVRSDTLGNGLVQATNFRPMYGNVIDGLRWIGADGGVIETTAPAVATEIRLDNWHDGVLSDVYLSVQGGVAIRLGVNHASNGNLIENCILSSDQATVVSNFQCERNAFRGNRITSTSGGVGQLLALYGNNSIECLVDGNIFAAPNASSWSPTILTGTATARYTASNMGKPVQASGTMVMSAGTKYVGVDHGLGVTPQAYSVVPRGNVGVGQAPPWSAVASNVINAQTSSNVASDVTFAWWAKAEFGNL